MLSSFQNRDEVLLSISFEQLSAAKCDSEFELLRKKFVEIEIERENVQNVSVHNPA